VVNSGKARACVAAHRSAKAASIHCQRMLAGLEYRESATYGGAGAGAGAGAPTLPAQPRGSPASPASPAPASPAQSPSPSFVRGGPVLWLW
jgi:hypothetical protein